MIGQIDTPLGTVGLRLDGNPCAHDGLWEVYDRSDYALSHPVDGNYRIAYWHEPDGSDHVLECKINPSRECEGGPASGEKLEAAEIGDGRSRLVIAVEYGFEGHAQGHGELEYDYKAHDAGFGVAVELPADAKEQWIVFGVSWVDEVDEVNGTNPWLLGDPGVNRPKLPTGVYTRDGSGPYGKKTIEWFLGIERPWERKDDILSLFEGLMIAEHTNAEDGYDHLYDGETAADILNPSGGEDIWMEFAGEYTLGIGGWHAHYDAYEGDYRMLKDDIAAILAGDMRFLVAFVGDDDWRGSQVLRGEMAYEDDGWDALRSMGLPSEFMQEFEARGGFVKVVSWLPERCATLRVEPKRQA